MLLDFFKKKKKIPAPWKKYYTDDELNIKIKNISLYKQVVESSIKYPNYTAYEYFGKKVKYKKFIKQIDKCSYALKKI